MAVASAANAANGVSTGRHHRQFESENVAAAPEHAKTELSALLAEGSRQLAGNLPSSCRRSCVICKGGHRRGGGVWVVLCGPVLSRLASVRQRLRSALGRRGIAGGCLGDGFIQRERFSGRIRRPLPLVVTMAAVLFAAGRAVGADRGLLKPRNLAKGALKRMRMCNKSKSLR